MNRLLKLFFFTFWLSQNLIGVSCSESLQQLNSSKVRAVFEIYDELQKVDENGKTKLALQKEFDDLIHEGGGGACASTTAFNFLQGLRQLSGEKPLEPHAVLNEAFEKIPVLLDGRVTNQQMTQLLTHFEKYLPEKKLEISAVRSPQSKPAAGELPGLVVKKFDDAQFKTQLNELKMVIYQVHDDSGQLLGRHFVVLKRYEGLEQLGVIDPNAPHKEFKLKVTELPDPQSDVPLTRISRADGKKHSAGWVYTLDTIFTVKLQSSNPNH